VTLQEGTFTGMEGDVLAGPDTEGRVRVSLTIFGRPVVVELECHLVCGLPVNEERLLACRCLHGLHAVLRSSPHPLSPRKWRLFGCACARRLWDLLPNERWRHAVEMSERYADGATSLRQLKLALRGLSRELTAQVRQDGYPRNSRALTAMTLAWAAARSDTDGRHVVSAANQAPTATAVDWRVHLLRDVAGNPFREPSVVDPAWLGWSNGLVLQLAWAIYEEQRWQDMPVLADTLEDAGCADAAILSHCRGAGPHARGCWVVDRILDRE
jgi:hypothetical protein